MLIYIAGPYSNGDTAANIAVAREALVQLLAAGHSPFCPHTHTAGLEHDPRLMYRDFMRLDLDILSLCEAVLMLPGWSESPGSNIEHDHATLLGIPIYYDLSQLTG